MYFIEGNIYRLKEFCEKLYINNKVGIEIIEYLNKLNIVDTQLDKSSNNISDKLIDKSYIKFTYVGSLFINKVNIRIMPKYLDTNDLKEEKLINEHFKDIIQALIKMEKSSGNQGLENEGDLYDNSNLKLVNDLIKDYTEKGIYSSKRVDASKYLSDIDWNRTIGNTDPYIINKAPIYLELNYFNAYSHQDNLVTEIHSLILQECMDIIKKIGLNSTNILRKIPTSNFHYLEDIGGDDFILGLIEKEMISVFENNKLSTLNLIYDFLKSKNKRVENENILYGIRNYWVVWEKLTQNYFNDKSSYFIDNYINKPKWHKYHDTVYYTDRALEPDIILDEKESTKHYFFIIDAKYYKLTTRNNKIYNQPGISDIIKQQFYSVAFQSYLEQFEEVIELNIFALPTFEKNNYTWGEIDFSIFKEENYKKYNKIKVLMLNCVNVTKSYLKNEKIHMSELKAFLD